MRKTADRYLIKDSGYIMDLTTGHSFTANMTGLYIFRALREGCTPDEVVGRLCREFVVDAATARRDLDEFLQDLSVFRLHET